MSKDLFLANLAWMNLSESSFHFSTLLSQIKWVQTHPHSHPQPKQNIISPQQEVSKINHLHKLYSGIKEELNELTLVNFTILDILFSSNLSISWEIRCTIQYGDQKRY